MFKYAIQGFIILLLTSSFSLYGQTKIYSEREIKWLMRKGFDMSSYDNDNQTIDYNLEQALHYKKRSDRYLLYGGLITVGSTAIPLIIFNLIPEGDFVNRLLTLLIASSISGAALPISTVGALTNRYHAHKYLAKARRERVSIKFQLDNYRRMNSIAGED